MNNLANFDFFFSARIDLRWMAATSGGRSMKIRRRMLTRKQHGEARRRGWEQEKTFLIHCLS
jgi:hypothetical protein